MSESPYVGLNPFTTADAQYFFGREAEARTLEANLRSSRLTLLYGPTGVGKTSLLNAGLMSKLEHAARQNVERRGGRPGLLPVLFRNWQQETETAICDTIREQIGRIVPRFPLAELHACVGLEVLLEAWTKLDLGDILLVFDQFELFFVYHAKPEEDPFIHSLARCVGRSDMAANIMISMREEWLPSLDIFKDRMPGLFENYLRLKPLDRTGAAAAVEKPVACFNRKHGTGIEMGPGLVEAVLAKSCSAPPTAPLRPAAGGLRGIADSVVRAFRPAPQPENRDCTEFAAPALQVIMQRLWSEEIRSGSNKLRVRTLEKLARRRDIVDQYVRYVVQALNYFDRRLAAVLVDRLVTPAGTKTAQTLTSLAGYAGRRPERIQTLIGRLGPLLSDVAPPRGSRDHCYEISHDVLASALARWQAERTQRRKFLSLAAGSALVCGALFGYAIYNSQQKTSAIVRRLLSESDLVFATKPTGLDLSTLLAIEAMRLDPSPEAEMRLRRAANLLATPMARVDHDAAVNQVAFSPDRRKFATRAGRTLTLGEVPSGRVLKSIPHELAINWFAFSPDSRTIATAGADGRVRIWDTSTYVLVHTLTQDEAVNAVAYSPDGGTIATASDDGTVRIWDPGTGKQRGGPLFHGACVFHLAFSPLRDYLISAGDDGGARVWDLQQHRQVATLQQIGPRDRTRSAKGPVPTGLPHPGQVNAIAVSDIEVSQGHLEFAVTAGEFGVCLWRLPEGTQAGNCMPGATSSLQIGDRWLLADDHSWRWSVKGIESSNASSPTQRIAVLANGITPVGDPMTANSDGAARLWESSYPRFAEVRRFIHRAAVTSVDSAMLGEDPYDERRPSQLILTGSADRTARLWGIDTQFGVQFSHFASVSDDGNQVAWLDDSGVHLLSAPFDGAPMDLSWPLEPELGPLRAAMIGDGETAIAQTRDGTGIAAFRGRVIRVWWPGERETPRKLTLDEEARAIRFSGADLVVLLRSKVEVWNRNRTAPTFSAGLPYANDFPNSLHTSPDGRFLFLSPYDRFYMLDRAAASPKWIAPTTGGPAVDWAVNPDSRLVALCTGARQISIVELATEKTTRTGNLTSPCRSVAFHPRKPILVVGTTNELALIDLAADAVSLLAADAPARRLAYDADGKRLAAVLDSKTIQVWDTANNRLLRSISPALADTVGFSPDSRFLAARSGNSVRLFSLSAPDLIMQACGLMIRNLTAAERLQYLPGRTWDPPCRISQAAADRIPER